MLVCMLVLDSFYFNLVYLIDKNKSPTKIIVVLTNTHDGSLNLSSRFKSYLNPLPQQRVILLQQRVILLQLQTATS